jgi:Domain of unknown function (DUF4160)
MPTISYFYGIAIRMYFLDHPPPHFSAEYQGHEANVSIETGEVITGHLPRTAARLVREWALEHQSELQANWDRARQNQPLIKVPGADE